MFVVWAMDEEPEEKKLGSQLLRGVDFGTGVGLVYGFWDASCDRYYPSQSRGWFQYNAMEHRLMVSPAEAFLPTVETKSHGLRFSLFCARFLKIIFAQT